MFPSGHEMSFICQRDLSDDDLVPHSCFTSFAVLMLARYCHSTQHLSVRGVQLFQESMIGFGVQSCTVAGNNGHKGLLSTHSEFVVWSEFCALSFSYLWKGLGSWMLRR
eukprot:TRINITY_DN14719_c0_g1_i12.p1 TRINITY_DN14719_c0_g1~~TRINITY_DN14719_c0_g1_i12.p1  ORF type:complete len:109 (-),score=16.56 TRINITY_DN14719_c0_g1_i12:82-408(-)